MTHGLASVSANDDGSPPVTRSKILLAAGAMAGVQICYSAQINHGSSTLLALGLDEASVSLAWLAGPLSGLIVQPIVGIASDSCTSVLGRRTPFLIGGMVFTVTALLVFPNAALVAAHLVRDAARAERLALVIAVFTFFLLDFAIQAIQAPLRALIIDISPGELLPVGNAYLALFVGFGNLFGSLLSSARLTNVFPVFGTDVQALFTLAAVALIFTFTLCVVSVKETPLPAPGFVVTVDLEDFAPSNTEEDKPLLGSEIKGPAAIQGFIEDRLTGLGYDTTGSQEQLLGGVQGFVNGASGASSDGSKSEPAEERDGNLVNAYRILRDAPRPFWRVFAVQVFSWFGFFTLFVFVNAWVGSNVYLGRGNMPAESLERVRFEDGVRLGGLGNTLTALVTIMYSQITTPMIDCIGILATYAISLLVEAICLLSAHYIRGSPGQSQPSVMLKLAAVFDIGAFGIVWATSMGVPWAIVGKALNDDPEYQPQVGLFTTIFNASQSFPQLFVALGSPFILYHFDNDVSAVMFAGGILALVGFALIFLLRVDQYWDGQVLEFDSGSSDAEFGGEENADVKIGGAFKDADRALYTPIPSAGR
jgi:MFS family permease